MFCCCFLIWVSFLFGSLCFFQIRLVHPPPSAMLTTRRKFILFFPDVRSLTKGIDPISFDSGGPAAGIFWLLNQTLNTVKCPSNNLTLTESLFHPIGRFFQFQNFCRLMISLGPTCASLEADKNVDLPHLHSKLTVGRELNRCGCVATRRGFRCRQSASCAAVIRVNIYWPMHSKFLFSSVSVLPSVDRRFVRFKVQYLFYHSGGRNPDLSFLRGRAHSDGPNFLP